MNDTPTNIRAAHNGINAALSAAQAEMGPAIRHAVNPHLKNRYADLSSVTDACMPALNRHGIAVFHVFSEGKDDGEGSALITVLAHEGGERIETRVPLLLGKRDMQGLGSAITYARRYGLMMLAGIAPEDDDGNEAAKSPAPAQRSRDQGPPPPAANDLPPLDVERESERLCAIFGAAPDEAKLRDAWAASADTRRQISQADPEAYERVKAASVARKDALAAAAIPDAVPF